VSEKITEGYIRRVSELFTGYREALNSFDEAFDEYTTLGRKKVVLVMGPIGAGKTWFLNYVIETRIKPLGVLHLYVNLKDVSSWIRALHLIQSRLSDEYGFNAPNFTGLWYEIRRKVLEYDLQDISDEDPMFPEIYLLASFPKSYYALKKSAETFQLEITDTLEEAPIHKLVYLLPLALAQDIAEEIKEREISLAIILDSLDNIDELEPLSWFIHALPSVLIVIATRNEEVANKLNELINSSSLKIISLNGFDRNELREYLTKRGVKELEVFQSLLKSDRILPIHASLVLDVVDMLGSDKASFKSIDDVKNVLKERISGDLQELFSSLYLLYKTELSDFPKLVDLSGKEELLEKIISSAIVEPVDLGRSIFALRQEFVDILSMDKAKVVADNLVKNLERLYMETGDVRYLEQLISAKAFLNEDEAISMLSQYFRNFFSDGAILDLLELIDSLRTRNIFRLENNVAGLEIMNAEILDIWLGLDKYDLSQIISSPHVRPLYLLKALNISAEKFLRAGNIGDGEKLLKRVIDYAGLKDPLIISEIIKAYSLLIRYSSNIDSAILNDVEKLYLDVSRTIEDKDVAETISRNMISFLINAAWRYLKDGNTIEAENALKELLNLHSSLSMITLRDVLHYLSALFLRIRIEKTREGQELLPTATTALNFSLNDERDFETGVLVRKALIAKEVGEHFFIRDDFEKASELLDRSSVLYREVINRAGWYYLRILKDLGEIYRMLGECSIHLGRDREAVTYFNTSIEYYRLYLDYSRYKGLDKLNALIRSYKLLIDAFVGLNKTKNALSALEESYKLFQKLSEEVKGDARVLKGIAWVLQEYGRLEILNGNYDRARSRLEESLKICEKLPESEKRILKAESLSLLGELFLRMGDYDNAIKNFLEIVEVLKSEESSEVILKSYVLLGEIGIRLDRIDEASKWFTEALNYRISSAKEDSWKACAKVGIAHTVLESGEADKAIEIVNEALRDLRGSGGVFQKYFMGRGYIVLGKGLNEKGQSEDAIRAFRDGIDALEDIAKESKDPLLVTIYAQLYYSLGKIYLRQREFSEAYEAFRTALDHGLRALYLSKSRDSYILGLLTMAQTNIARTLYRSGRREEAAKIIRDAVKYGDELVKTLPIRKYKIYYSRALQEACLMNADANKEITKEYYRKYRLVMRQLLDEIEWRDSQLISFFLSTAEEMKKKLMNEFSQELIEDFTIIVERISQLILSDTVEDFEFLVRLFSKAVILKADLLWKSAQFEKAYSSVENALSLIKQIEEKFSENEDKLLKIQLAKFDLLTMKAIMKYFGEGDVDTVRNCIDECREIIESVRDRVNERTLTRMICDMTILEARLNAFLHDYRSAYDKLVLALEKLELLAEKGERARAQKYKQIMKKIIRYVLSDKKLDPQLRTLYKKIFSRIRNPST